MQISRTCIPRYQIESRRKALRPECRREFDRRSSTLPLPALSPSSDLLVVGWFSASRSSSVCVFFFLLSMIRLFSILFIYARGIGLSRSSYDVVRRRGWHRRRRREAVLRWSSLATLVEALVCSITPSPLLTRCSSVESYYFVGFVAL